MTYNKNTQNLMPLFGLLSSLGEKPSVPILRDIASLVTDTPRAGKEEGFLRRKIHRVYSRLCRITEELKSLDFKKAAPGISPEDFVFSMIDFSRYRKIEEKEFKKIFPESLSDFGEDFFKRNFGHSLKEIESLIEGSYVKNEGFCKLRQETPLVLSVMRTLEASLETLPLFGIQEINGELQTLEDFSGFKAKAGKIYSSLVFTLDGVSVTHEDGMVTKLFIKGDGALAGTFMPGNKAWTRVLIPAN